MSAAFDSSSIMLFKTFSKSLVLLAPRAVEFVSNRASYKRLRGLLPMVALFLAVRVHDYGNDILHVRRLSVGAYMYLLRGLYVQVLSGSVKSRR